MVFKDGGLPIIISCCSGSSKERSGPVRTCVHTTLDFRLTMALWELGKGFCLGKCLDKFAL